MCWRDNQEDLPRAMVDWDGQQERVMTFFVISATCWVGRVFTNDPGHQGSIPDPVIWKTLKMVLDASLLNIQYSKVWIKVKWSIPGKGVASFPTPWCSSYWKGSLQLSLVNNRPTYLTDTYIYIYIYIYINKPPKTQFFCLFYILIIHYLSY